MKQTETDLVILDKISAFLEEYDITSEILNGIINVTFIKSECDATILIDEDKIVNLSFDVRVQSTDSAYLTQLLIEFFNKEDEFKIEIREPYALVMNEQNIMTDMLFGKEALDYYHLPTTPKIFKSKCSVV